MKKSIQIFIAIVMTIFVFVGSQWYTYIKNTKSPYDEIGIELNSRMPYPVRKWGCDQLKKTFPRHLPPYGCAASSEKGKEFNWI